MALPQNAKDRPIHIAKVVPIIMISSNIFPCITSFAFKLIQEDIGQMVLT